MPSDLTLRQPLGLDSLGSVREKMRIGVCHPGVQEEEIPGLFGERRRMNVRIRESLKAVRDGCLPECSDVGHIAHGLVEVMVWNCVQEAMKQWENACTAWKGGLIYPKAEVWMDAGPEH